ncbi:MAG: hypothetical protein CMI54_03730 [Parcubacteria group bacterium]|nr:hypothetical protein [Parcubacteria group bacterium]|tara:strand:+ start:47 stop:484 length:438 start_codon:yes stop_codon:yes gene_type:complete
MNSDLMDVTQVQQIQDSVQNDVSILLGEYGWMFLAVLTILFFKTTIESLIAGLVVFVGNDYNNDDIVILDGRPGRIVRVSMWKTTFYLYNIKTGADNKKFVSGGTKISVENDKLKDLKIEKPLESVDLEKLDLVYAGESTPTKVY